MSVDKYHHVQRLDLTRADGLILHPMYMVYRPPKMLPTTTLNPTPTGRHSKRDRSEAGLHRIVKEELINPDRWWWLGVWMTSVGGVAFFCS